MNRFRGSGSKPTFPTSTLLSSTFTSESSESARLQAYGLAGFETDSAGDRSFYGRTQQQLSPLDLKRDITDIRRLKDQINGQLVF
jgi:hypothetical protein